MRTAEIYLRALGDAGLGGGVAQESEYAALANLLNQVVRYLERYPRVDDACYVREWALDSREPG